jgi:hypothetical protein
MIADITFGRDGQPDEVTVQFTLNWGTFELLLNGQKNDGSSTEPPT